MKKFLLATFLCLFATRAWGGETGFFGEWYCTVPGDKATATLTLDRDTQTFNLDMPTGYAVRLFFKIILAEVDKMIIVLLTPEKPVQTAFLQEKGNVMTVEWGDKRAPRMECRRGMDKRRYLK